MKSLYDISWQVPEEEYRKDPAYSYSILAKYERGGFNELPHLFDKISTPSLTLGSAVDALITGGQKEFDDNFLVLDFKITEGGMDVIKALVAKNLIYDDFSHIPVEIVSQTGKEVGFWKADKWDNIRYREICKTGDVQACYKALSSSGKQVISTDTYNKVLAMVSALKESEATKWYFQEDNPFDNIERLYQLKFKTTLNDIDYRIMADLVAVDHDNKTIQMCDLKTSGHHEWDFYQSFVDWRYDIQARLYSRVVRNICAQDEYFKDFTFLPYIFIVVNKDSLTPLTWVFEDTFSEGEITIGNKVFRDPETIAKELDLYLTKSPSVPKEINQNKPNSLCNWIRKL